MCHLQRPYGFEGNQMCLCRNPCKKKLSFFYLIFFSIDSTTIRFLPTKVLDKGKNLLFLHSFICRKIIIIKAYRQQGFIPLTLSRHLYLSFIALRKSCRQYRYPRRADDRKFFAGQLTLVGPCVEVHRGRTLMSTSLHSPKYPACFILLGWFAKWELKGTYRCCFVGCCFQDLFKTACTVLVWIPSFLLSVSVESIWCNHVVVSI